MLSARNCSRLCILLVALAGACATEDEIEDLGTLADGKTDTALPRTVEVELEPGASKRFRITTAAFVATLAQDGEVDAQLAAKHYEHLFTSEVSTAPRVAAAADGTARNWTLTVYNRGDEPLAATVVVDIPRDAEALGIVSDIDKTVLPPTPTTTTSTLPAPYPGIATLLRILEGDVAGDLHYVTARTPEGVAEIPAWMAMHDVPEGTIDTGLSGVPWVAQPEKVRDIARLFEAQPEQPFVLFGDTSHRDPEVYAEIRTTYPTRVAAIFIHKVNATVSPTRVAGMHLVNNYAEAAAIAYGAELLTEPQARTVMNAARAEGLAITDAEIDALLDAAR